jgi:hypothetical protein
MTWNAFPGPNVPVAFDYHHNNLPGDTLAVTGGTLLSGGLVVNTASWGQIEFKAVPVGGGGTMNFRAFGITF